MTIYNIKTDFGAVGDGVADDSPALVAAGDALNGTSGNQLFVPAGTFGLLTNYESGTGRTAQFWSAGIKQFVMFGASQGATTIFGAPQFGGFGIKQNGSRFAKIATVAAGSNAVRLLTPSQVSLFFVGQWVNVTGLNIQDIFGVGYGFPPNLHFYEYQQITDIDTNPASPTYGRMTFSAPLKNSYKATWPEQNQGSAFEVNSGGPAGIYSLDPTWDIDALYRDFTLTGPSPVQVYAIGRKIVWQDCTFLNAIGPIPTQNKYWAAIRCTAASTGMEVDKLTTDMVMDQCTWNQVQFQSSSVDTSTITNCHIGALYGHGKIGIIRNNTLGLFQPGTTSFGAASYLDASDNVISSEWRDGGFTEDYSVGINKFATMNSGVIAILNGTAITNVTDNGSGKARYTVAGTGAFTPGLYVPVGRIAGKATTSAPTSAGSSVLTFASVPAWIAPGLTLFGQGDGVNGVVDGTTVTGVTSTTITMSNPATAIIPAGTDILIVASALSGWIKVLAVIDAVTADFDVSSLPGFVFAGTASINPGEAVRWAIPGTFVKWQGQLDAVGIFKVVDVTQDANFTYVHTDQTGTWPPLPLIAGKLSVATFGVQSQVVARCSGVRLADQYSLPGAQNKTAGSYFDQTFTGSPSPLPTLIPMIGNVVSVMIDVKVPYTGTIQPTLFFHYTQFDNGAVVDSAGNLVTFGPVVDAKVFGKRMILPTDNVSNPTAQPNDRGMLLPAGGSWQPRGGFGQPQYENSTGTFLDISGEDPATWPVIEMEIILDTGMVVTIPSIAAFAINPARLRIH
jgi:hypothetical protein